MFPLRDINPTLHTPVATWWLIGINVLAWVFIQGLGGEVAMAKSLCQFGLIPADLLGSAPRNAVIPVSDTLACTLQDSRPLLTLLSHMFMHGGWFHVITNMWFLYIFGDNVEDALGASRFVMFYLLCGLAAALTQIMANATALIPMVGASGAIGGVLGAYARLFPQAKVVTLIPLGFYFFTTELPAIAMLGYWFFLQLAGGIPALSSTGGGVAFWAHVGGFIAGLMLVGVFGRRDAPYEY
ncbi:MAG: rhomboid family intramembrane serine protease [Methylococcaceae bacterium]|nr:MAG: rhomboid family intramembrane serine protease [Methylococcaceae bacterium]